MSGRRRSLGQYRRNWRESDDPMALKLIKTVRNNAKKVITGQTCCGHPGEPGC